MANFRSTNRSILVLACVGMIVNMCLLCAFTFSCANHVHQFSALTIASDNFEIRSHGLVTPSSDKPSSPALRSHRHNQQAMILYGAPCSTGDAHSTHPLNYTNEIGGLRFTSADQFAQPDTRAPLTL